MKYTTAALGLISATLSVAAPATTSGYAVPSILKIHNIATNLNTQDTKTSSVRENTVETSTLYDIPIPAVAAGRTCGLVFRAASGSDDVEGAKALNIFSNLFTDLASLTQGNLRNQELASIVFNPDTGLYDFTKDITPTIDSFPCQAGQTLHWEAVASGSPDVNIVQQDFSYDGTHVPNGISVAWW